MYKQAWARMYTCVHTVFIFCDTQHEHAFMYHLRGKRLRMCAHAPCARTHPVLPSLLRSPHSKCWFIITWKGNFLSHVTLFSTACWTECYGPRRCCMWWFWATNLTGLLSLVALPCNSSGVHTFMCVYLCRLLFVWGGAPVFAPAPFSDPPDHYSLHSLVLSPLLSAIHMFFLFIASYQLGVGICRLG